MEQRFKPETTLNSTRQVAASSRHRIVCERARRRSNGGFTLIEIMVALAVFALMLTIILVPINLSIDLLHIGRARSEVRQASQITVDQIERELRQAVHVFPNDHVPGVTERYPYKIGNISEAPYYNMAGQTVINNDFIVDSSSGACSGGINRTGNRARIDFLVARRIDGAVQTPVKPEYYLVTYYARRLNIPDTGDQIFDPISNPIVIYRAQIPYKLDETTGFPAPGFTNALNLNPGPSRYPLSNSPTGTCGAGNDRNINRGAMWLVQSGRGEPNLEPLTRADAGAVAGSHTLVTPRGMGLVAIGAMNDRLDPPTAPNYTPTTSFVCEDTDGDGKINRVKIALELGQYDTVGADVRNGSPVDQRARFPKVVDLPNIR